MLRRNITYDLFVAMVFCLMFVYFDSLSEKFTTHTTCTLLRCRVEISSDGFHLCICKFHPWSQRVVPVDFEVLIHLGTRERSPNHNQFVSNYSCTTTVESTRPAFPNWKPHEFIIRLIQWFSTIKGFGRTKFVSNSVEKWLRCIHQRMLIIYSFHLL